MPLFHRERHRTQHIGWLRAAVLGANDGIVSTASLIVGVAASGADNRQILTAAIAGLVAGSMSMAAGEYVSVSSQSDTERADIDRERIEIEQDLEHEREELAAIYVDRGLDRNLAKQVALQLMQQDALAAHVRDELGISEIATARPLQAALASAASFAVGALLPVLSLFISPASNPELLAASTSLAFLAMLGALAAHAGGAGILKGSLRVTFWGAAAMAVTAAAGALFGAPS